MSDILVYTAAITATNGSTAVTGAATTFIADGIRAGDVVFFVETSGPVPYPVDSVTSATALVLDTTYRGTTGGSKTILVMRRWDQEKASDTYRLINTYTQRLEDTISVSQAGIRYVYSNVLTMTDPGAGFFRLNNAIASSVTAIAIDDQSGETGNPDAAAFINSFDDSSAVIKGFLYVKKAGDPATFMVYAITGLTDNVGWSQLAVTYVAGNGSLLNNDAVRFEFYRTGNDGFEAGTRLTYSTTTTDSDPGTGIFRFNNATFASISQIFIDNADVNSNTITALLDLFDDSTTTGARGIVRLQKTGDPSVYRDFTVTGAVVDGTGYRKIPVTPITTNGTWTNADPFTLTFFRTGNAGADGFQPGYRFTFSTTTTDADPGAGFLRLNNAAAASATQAFIDNVDGASATITTWLDGLDDSTQTNHRGYLRIQKVNDPAVYREFVVTGAVVDGTGYRKVPISLVQEAGVLANNDGLVLTFSRTGNAGTDGIQPGYRLTFSTTTTDADPGAGTFRFNNATFASITNLFIDNLDAAGGDITAWLDSLDDPSSAIKGVLRIEQIGTPTTYREFRVNGTVIDGTGYRKVPVQPVATNGTLAGGASVAVTWFRAGDAGTSIISDGDKGDISVSGSGSIWTIDNETVTLAKLQQISTGGFLGRNTVGTGAVEQIPIATALTMLGQRERLTGARTIFVRTVPATVTITIASPGVVTWTSHGLTTNDPVVFDTTGALPTGITAGTIYYATVLSANTFNISLTVGGGAINTTGTQSGTHTAQTGNNSNNGLAQTRAGALLTLQGAIDLAVGSYDFAGFDLTIQLADGLYSQATVFTAPWTGGGKVIVNGNSSTPANVKLTVAGNVITVQGVLPGLLDLQNFRLSSTSAGALVVNSGVGRVRVSNLVFHTATTAAHMNASGTAASIVAFGNYSITGGGTAHMDAIYGGQILVNNVTVTNTGTPNISSAFVFSWRAAAVDGFNTVWSGSATGPRYTAIENGVIITVGGGASFFPGNVAGSTATGGQYT
jgi:hypothetical protein